MIVVDPDSAVPQRIRYPLRAIEIVRPDRSGETVDRVVSECNCLRLRGEGFNREYWPERFVLHTAHLGVAPVKNCR